MNRTVDRSDVADVLVIGAGPAGLAAAHELLRAGFEPRIVDAAERVAQPWRDRHDRLHLNTHRRFSALPGMPIPRAAGSFPHRDDLVTYLEDYERELGVDVSYRMPVTRLDRRDGVWTAQTPTGEIIARDVVVATGPDRVPVRPYWPGEAEFMGRVVHAAEVRELDGLAGERVLIVGGGNSGVDLASALTRVPVRELWVSVRSGVTVVPRRLGGIPLHPLAVASRTLPVWYQDLSARLLSWVAFGDLRRFGLLRPSAGAKTLFLQRGVSPATDDGFIAALAQQRVRMVAEVASMRGSSVSLTDGQVLAPDMVVCATGYRSGLEPLVGHVEGVLDVGGRPTKTAAAIPTAPGLWFVGHRPPFHGNLYARGPEARRLVWALRSSRQSRRTTPHDLSAST